MKTKHWITRLVALSAVASAGLAYADAGIRDREDPFRDFKSTKSRAEVRAELDASPAPVAAANDARGENNLDFKSTKSREEVRSELDASRARDAAPNDARGESNIGARGVPGSRYSGRTREEVRQELRQYRETQKPYSPDYLYFGS